GRSSTPTTSSTTTCTACVKWRGGRFSSSIRKGSSATAKSRLRSASSRIITGSEWLSVTLRCDRCVVLVSRGRNSTLRGPKRHQPEDSEGASRGQHQQPHVDSFLHCHSTCAKQHARGKQAGPVEFGDTAVDGPCFAATASRTNDPVGNFSIRVAIELHVRSRS